MLNKVSNRLASVCLLAALLAVVYILHCSAATPVTLASYLSARLGVNIEMGHWMVAKFQGYNGVNAIAVLVCEEGLMTEDGDWLPVAQNEVSLEEVGPTHESLVGLKESEEWFLFHHYIEVPSRLRKALRSSLSGGAVDGGDVIRDLIPFELVRLTRMLRDQAHTWSDLVELSEKLERMARFYGAEESSLRPVIDFRGRIIAACEFRLASSIGDGRIMRAIRSEVDSVGGAYLHNMCQPFPGLFSVDFHGFKKAELRHLLDFWDSTFITRSSVIKEQRLVAVSLGDRVKALAAQLTGISSCSASEFLSWIDAR